MVATPPLPLGTFAPIPTPLGLDGRFDAPALRAHLSLLEDGGLHGVLVLGTNGEFPSFSLQERLEIAEAAAEETRLQKLLGIGATALPEALELLEAAASHGYDAVLCAPPFYFRGASVEGLADFFSAVLDAARLPLLLYHIPQLTGIGISEALLDRLGAHERLAGIKDSSGDPAELRRLAPRFSKGAYFVGHDRLLRDCVEAGGRGSITAAASVAPALVRAVHDGQADQAQLDAVRDLLEQFGLGPAVKAILRRRGVGAYASRPPLRGLEREKEELLLTRFEELMTGHSATGDAQHG